MSFKVNLKALLGCAVIALSGCASEETQQLAREAAMPPVVVTRAAMNGPYWQNVSIQEVTGAPEFRWFDGGGIITTRPTRVQASKVFTDDLEKVGMLAPDRISSDYMLYVNFEDLHGPDVIFFTDKRASAAVTFRLVDWRAGRVIKEKRVIAAYDANWGGIMPEQFRYSFFGPIGIANDHPVLVGRDVIASYVLLLNKGTPMSDVSQIGPGSGGPRRVAAWHGLLNLAFDEFMNELSADGSVVFKQAVSCDATPGFSPAGFNSRRAGVEYVETARTYAVDCPTSNFMESMTHRIYPQRFGQSGTAFAAPGQGLANGEHGSY